MAVDDLLTLAEARDALRIPDTDHSRDTTLASIYIPAITKVVEDVTGPVVRRSFTITTAGGSRSVLLPTSLSSITGVTEDGTTLTAGTDYVADLTLGILYRGTATVRAPFGGGIGSVSITYTAGKCASTATVPANIKLAARMILVDSFDSDQQGEHPTFGDTGEAETVETPSGFRIRAAAYTYLEPDADHVPGIA